MAKKTKKAAPVSPEQMTPEQQAFQQRLTDINNFNREHIGEVWIDASKTVEQKDIDELKAQYEQASKDFWGTEYTVADAESGKRVAEFLRKFITTGFWMQDMYQGVIKFDEYIGEYLDKVEKEGEQELKINVNAMLVCYNMFQHCGGIGIEAARAMKEMEEDYDIMNRMMVGFFQTWQKDYQYVNKVGNLLNLYEKEGYYALLLGEEGERLYGFNPATVRKVTDQDLAQQSLDALNASMTSREINPEDLMDEEPSDEKEPDGVPAGR